ncbi:MAG: cytochrome P450 [Ilumatobacteraceae bacterium]
MPDRSAPQRPDSLPDLDILSHDVYARALPLDAFDSYRRAAPVAWVNETPRNGHAGRGFWSLSRWNDILTVQRDWRTFSSQLGGTEIEELEPDALAARMTMLETDPPRHTALRRLVNPSFSRRAVASYEEHATALVGEVIDAVIGRDRFDGVYDVARELPIRMLTGLLGVPDDDAAQLFRWADQIIYHADPDYSAAVIDHADTDPFRLLPFRSPVSETVFAYLRPLLEQRLRQPGGDVLSILAAAQVDGVALTEREQGTFFLLLLIAGNETTRHSLAHAMRAFSLYPEQLELLADRPDLLDGAVEEVLRWTCPQLHFRRTATVGTELGGVPIAAGDKVVTWFIAGNHDPEVFVDPRRFDVTRSPNPHVTFGGAGVHLCLGQWMARLEVRGFLQALAERVRAVESLGPPVRVRSNFINGLKSLPLRFVAA